MEELFELARKVLGEHLGIAPETIDWDTTFEEIDADSIDVVEMIMAIEDHYEVEFPEDDLDQYKTFGSLIKALWQYLNSR